MPSEISLLKGARPGQTSCDFRHRHKVWCIEATYFADKDQPSDTFPTGSGRMKATCVLKVGDQVHCLDTQTSFFVRGFHPVDNDVVKVDVVDHAHAGSTFVKVRSLVKHFRGRPRFVHVPRNQHVVRKGPKDNDMAYNRRKDKANAVFYAKFRQIVSAPEVRALLLDAPPRGFPSKKPNTAEFLIEKKRVPPSNIAVVNPCASIAKTLVEMGVGAHKMMFNDFVMKQRPDVPYNYAYLDACGFYGKQLRSGLRAIFENHDRWLADEALLNIVVSKRNGKDVPGLIKKDLEKWSAKYGYGNVLSTLTTPDNPRMHTVTFFLKRFPQT